MTRAYEKAKIKEHFVGDAPKAQTLSEAHIINDLLYFYIVYEASIYPVRCKPAPEITVLCTMFVFNGP